MSLITISSIFEQDFDNFCDFCGNTCVSFLIDTTGYEDGLTEYIFRPIWFRYLHTPIKFSNDEKGKEAFLRNFCNQLNEVVFDFYTYCKENIDYFMYQTDPLNEGKPMSKNITSGINPINQNVDQAVDSTNLATGTSGQFITETVYNGVAWHKLVDAYFTPNRKTSLLKAFAWLFVTTYSPETKYDDKIEEKRYVELSFVDEDNNIIDEQKVYPTKSYFTMSEVDIQRPLMLDPQNVKKDVDIAGVVGTYEPNIYPEINDNVDLTQVKTYNTPSGYDGIGKVVITPPATAIPSNIKKDVNIGGVVGTYEPNILNYLNYDLDLTGDMDIEASDYNVDGIREVFIGIPVTARAENIKQGVNIGGIVGTYTATDTLGKRITNDVDPYTFVDNNVTTIRQSAFYRDTNITSFSSTSATQVNQEAFYYASGLITFNCPNVTGLQTGAFQSCSSLTNLTLSSNITLTTSQSSMFTGCANLNNVNIPNSTGLGSSIFSGCTNLTSLNSGTNTFNSVLSVGSYAFQNCTNITELYFPNATVMSANAFSKCDSLKTIDLGKISSIGSAFFGSGTNLTSPLDDIYLRKTGSICTLGNTSYLPDRVINVHVPSTLISTYQTANNWSTLYNNGKVIFVAL